MNKLVYTLLFFIGVALNVQAQGVVRGKVLDKQNDEALQFVTVRLTDSAGKLAGGGMTDVKGAFNIQGLKDGNYTLQISLVGYKDVKRGVQITPQKRTVHFNAIYMAED